jgi:hypothetical protein
MCGDGDGSSGTASAGGAGASVNDTSGLFGRYSGQISVSGPGVHTTAVVSTRNLAVSNGLVTGQGRGLNGFASYSLSFTL